MVDQHFLVTGAAGFIGAWTTALLVREGVTVTAFDLSTERRRLAYLLNEEELARVRFVQGDITDTEQVRRIVDQGVTHIVHLAALQVPACRADPPLGAVVNVLGTINVFEAARASGIGHVAYASSAAVYGAAEEYGPGPVSNDAPLRPRTLYGVFKQADEGMARVTWLDHGISSIGLRPYVVYGVGRDQGLTSTPTKAMLAAALGKPYHISFGGTFNLEYAADVARLFLQAARAGGEGARAFNVGGQPTHMAEIVQAIEEVRPEMRGRITFADTALPFPSNLDGSALEAALGEVVRTPLRQGVAETIAHFEELASRGQIGPAAAE